MTWIHFSLVVCDKVTLQMLIEIQLKFSSTWKHWQRRITPPTFVEVVHGAVEEKKISQINMSDCVWVEVEPVRHTFKRFWTGVMLWCAALVSLWSCFSVKSAVMSHCSFLATLHLLSTDDVSCYCGAKKKLSALSYAIQHCDTLEWCLLLTRNSTRGPQN